MARRARTPKTKLSSNGQVVIPSKIREQMGIKPGTVFLVSHETGSIVLTPQATDSAKETTPVSDNSPADIAGESSS